MSGDQGSSSAPVLHQRLYDAAVADSLHDLSLDFNKAYRGRCHTSVPVCMDDNDADAAPCDTTVVSAAHSQLDSMMAGFQAYLQYQQLVSQPKHAEVAGSAAGSSRQQPQVEQAQEQHLHSGSSSGGPDSSSASGSIDLLHCAVLIAKHAYPAADLEQVRKAVAELGRQAAALAATAEGGSAAAAAGSGAGGSRVRALAAAVSYVLYHLEGFGGAVDDFYHFDNQCINRLLETKQGEQGRLVVLLSGAAQPVPNAFAYGHICMAVTTSAQLLELSTAAVLLRLHAVAVSAARCNGICDQEAVLSNTCSARASMHDARHDSYGVQMANRGLQTPLLLLVVLLLPALWPCLMPCQAAQHS